MIIRELTVGIGVVLQKLHAVVCMADLNAVTLNGGVYVTTEPPIKPEVGSEVKTEGDSAGHKRCM